MRYAVDAVEEKPVYIGVRIVLIRNLWQFSQPPIPRRRAAIDRLLAVRPRTLDAQSSASGDCSVVISAQLKVHLTAMFPAMANKLVLYCQPFLFSYASHPLALMQIRRPVMSCKAMGVQSFRKLLGGGFYANFKFVSSIAHEPRPDAPIAGHDTARWQPSPIEPGCVHPASEIAAANMP